MHSLLNSLLDEGNFKHMVMSKEQRAKIAGCTSYACIRKGKVVISAGDIVKGPQSLAFGRARGIVRLADGVVVVSVIVLASVAPRVFRETTQELLVDVALLKPCAYIDLGDSLQILEPWI